MTQPPEFLDLARVVAPVGVRGEVKVRTETDDPLRLRELKTVSCLLANGERVQVTIETVTLRKDGVVIVKFVGFDSPEEATALRQARLQIPFAMAKREPGKILYADVLGMAVVEDLTGTPLGTVIEVLRAGQDLLEIRTPGGEEVLVPWVDTFVRRIDLELRQIRLATIEGLFGEARPTESP